MEKIHLRRLISLWIDGGIGQEDLLALSEELRASDESRIVYLQTMGINAELHNSADARRYLEEIEHDAEVYRSHHGLRSESSPQAASSNAWSGNAVLALAGFALAASILLMLTGWQFVAPDKSPLAESGEKKTATVREALATVGPASADCRWYVEHARVPNPGDFRSGDIIRVTRGELDITYGNGIAITLRAPAAYEFISSMKSRMVLGHLTAEVTDQGKGFSVLIPRATVVDLGTKFSVNVNSDGATDVVVFKGEVDVDYQADSAPRPRAQRLQMGEAVRLDAAGTASRIVSINNHSQSGVSNADQKEVIISEVRDNIERNSTLLNYYEIVHAGMQEDALAFVDREAHQWNGLDASGIPAYLLGGDYVKTFNNDKFNHEIRLSVKLAVPARLYILFDDRLPVPRWLQEGFRDTGDNVGMDTGPFFSKGAWHNMSPPCIGPGESVEDTFSIWVKEVYEPGDVFLGSTEAPKLEPNMYGIVAVPLDAQ